MCAQIRLFGWPHDTSCFSMQGKVIVEEPLFLDMPKSGFGVWPGTGLPQYATLEDA